MSFGDNNRARGESELMAGVASVREPHYQKDAQRMVGLRLPCSSEVHSR